MGKFRLLCYHLPYYKENRNEMISQSIIQDLQYFDIICIGNYGAIAAERLAKRRPHKYKIAVLNFKRKIKHCNSSGLGSKTIDVTSQPKGVDIIHVSIKQIVPTQRIVLLINGKRLLYKFLIFGEQSWQQNINEHPLAESLKCEYSRVFYNLHQYDQLLKDKGNIVFYVPEGPGKFRQSYPFLPLAQKIQNKKDHHLVILLQGNSFFPNCKEAHMFFEEQLNNLSVQIIYNVTNLKIDFLRRIFYYAQQKEQKQITYSSVFCLIADQVPKILSESGIDPYACSLKFLHNNQYDSIYVVGADTLPTTRTFYSSALQLHYSVQNILQRLKPKKNHNKSILCTYNGETKFKLALTNQQQAEIKHSYSRNACKISATGCICSLFSKYIDSYLLSQFWNFNNYGPPRYLWVPALYYSSKVQQLADRRQSQQQESVSKSG